MTLKYDSIASNVKNISLRVQNRTGDAFIIQAFVRWLRVLVPLLRWSGARWDITFVPRVRL